jgi:hypothetical protein
MDRGGGGGARVLLTLQIMRLLAGQEAHGALSNTPLSTSPSGLPHHAGCGEARPGRATRCRKAQEGQREAKGRERVHVGTCETTLVGGGGLRPRCERRALVGRCLREPTTVGWWGWRSCP